MSDAAATPPRVDRARTVLIVVAYMIVFFVFLPVLLWESGGRIDSALHLPPVHGSVWSLTGVLLAACGSGLTLWSMWLLRVEGKGWPISHLPPKHLVTRGPYARLRHPIYVGYTLAFAGAALLSGSWGRAAGATAILIVAWVLYAGLFEEPRLRARFAAASDR